MYTATIRQEGVTRSSVSSLVSHEYRKSLGSPVVARGNEDIDNARTHLNKDFIFINGEPKPLEKVQDIYDELDARLSKVKQTRTLKDGTKKQIAINKNSKVVRNFIVQLDPSYTGTVREFLAKSPAEQEKAMALMMGTLIQGQIGGTYGAHNLLSATLHMDEKSPHFHVLATPIDDEGRLRQESFINGKAGMRKFWSEARQKLRAEGYQADTMTREPGAEHLPLAEYKSLTARHAGRAQEAREQAVRTAVYARAEGKRLEGELAQAEAELSGLKRTVASKKAEAQAEEKKAEEARRAKAEAERKAQEAEQKAQEAQAEEARARASLQALQEEQEKAKAGRYGEAREFAQRFIQEGTGLLGRPNARAQEMLEQALEAREEVKGELAEREKALAKREKNLAFRERRHDDRVADGVREGLRRAVEPEQARLNSLLAPAQKYRDEMKKIHATLTPSQQAAILEAEGRWQEAREMRTSAALPAYLRSDYRRPATPAPQPKKQVDDQLEL